jgi:glycosyltransferase involved in cell wall biosynthesis
MHEFTDSTRPITSIHPLRIALLSPPMLPVPPLKYAGTERVVATLAEGLHQRGHEVTLFAPGDSDVSCELIPTVPTSLWSSGYRDDPSLFINLTLARAWSMRDRFDLIHSHVETLGLLFARMCPTPVLSTMHGRLDAPGIAATLAEFLDVPLVAISANQRRWFPQANWVGTVHHGLSFAATPFEPEPGDYLAFVGRVAPEKGVADAIALARSSGLPLRMAAKVQEPRERACFEAVVAPAINDGIVEFIGEVGSRERDELFAGALATVMLGPWPEPFGLVAIESMATGTPVIARRAGALPEVVEDGRTGFLVDDVEEGRLAIERVATLDRQQVRDLAVKRFSAERMVEDYERIFRRLVADGSGKRVAGALRALPVAPETQVDPPLAVGAAAAEVSRS